MTKMILNLTTAAAISLSAAGALAAESYYAFTAGNPDITSTNRAVLLDVNASEPSIAAELDRYHGVADGNSDLTFDISDAMSMQHDLPGIYGGFGGYPDAQF